MNVIRRDDLLVLPLAVAGEAVAEAHDIGGMERSAAGTVRVRHDKVATMQAVIPRAPALRFGETFVDEILQLHATDIAQHDAGDMR